MGVEECKETEMSEDKGIALSIFSGAGGLDFGVEQAGFRVAAAVEIDADAADTLEKNFHHLHSPVLRQDIRDLATSDLLRAAGLEAEDSPDLLVGGPPCVAFSKSGFWLDWKRDGRDPAAGLVAAYTRVLREAKPRAFLFENVYALTYRNSQSRPWFELLLKEIHEAKYQFRWQVLNAADYGVPQLRPRLFVIGVQHGEDLTELPQPSRGGRWERRHTGTFEDCHVSTAEAFEGLVGDPEPEEIVKGKYGHLLPSIPPGENYLHLTAKRGHPKPLFEWRSRYWNFLLKLDPSRPSPTIQARPGPYVGPFHWENRRLRVPELKRLFTFPDDFQFVGTRASVQRQIGNSVPPLLAQRVAEAL